MSSKWQYLTASAILVVAIAWFVLPDPSDSPVRDQSSPVRSPHPARVQPSPYLTSHEPASAGQPSRQNVDEGFHTEIEQLRMAVGADSTSVDDMLRLARLSQDGHQLEEAIVLYRRVVRVQPENHEAWLDLTRCYGLAQNWSAALGAVDEMLTHFPEDPSALYNKGAILANIGRADEAQVIWDKVLAQTEDEQLKAVTQASLERLNRQ